MKVKICGINDPVAFDTVVHVGADWVGFVFFPASPRYVSPDQAAALSARHRGGPLRVGLFVNPTETGLLQSACRHGSPPPMLPGYIAIDGPHLSAV